MAIHLATFQQGSTLTSLFISCLLFIQILHTTADTINRPSDANCTGQSYTENTNSVYGVCMNQGDLSSFDRNTCVRTAATDVSNVCFGFRQGIKWYDNCMLHYSDSNFFGVPDTAGISMINPNEYVNPIKPFSVVTDLVKVAPRQPLMFASEAMSNDSIFALAQCTVDLSVKERSKCLNTISADIQKNCWVGYRGGRHPARYEATPFLNLNRMPAEIVQAKCSPTNSTRNQLAIVESNRYALLSNMAVNAQTRGFYNTTIGRSSNQLYGLAQCQGDPIPPNDDCYSCLNNASRIRYFYRKRSGSVDFDEEKSGSVDLDGEKSCGGEKISQAASGAAVKLAARLIGIAEDSPLMAAAQGEDVDNSSSRYVLVQCTRDLSSEGCKKCLEKGLSEVGQCNRTNGWRYWSASCTLRYEVFPFYGTSDISSLNMPQPTVSSPQDDRVKKTKFVKAKVAAIIASGLGLTLLGHILYSLWWKLRRKNARGRAGFRDISPLHDADLNQILMDLAIIQAATSNFSDKNKLGEGGFGTVYKGIIHGGNEIAVKRLSKKSKQGSTEFKNEVKLIAKLQHRNLVRILGYCVEGEEKLLVYEFLPNNALDAFLFVASWIGTKECRLLQESQGVFNYLHEDSRLEVIHRDIKASNVLLDNEMNPKISDFGLAKIFGPDESEINASRIVATYGCMAPEYAMDGLRRDTARPLSDVCRQIMGHKETDELTSTQIFYPCMQRANVFFLNLSQKSMWKKQTLLSDLENFLTENSDFVDFYNFMLDSISYNNNY